MNAARADNCCLMNSRVASSLISPVFSSSLDGVIADEYFWLVEGERIKKDEGPPQVILNARTAHGAGRSRLQRNRLAGKRLVGQARQPVDGVLETARDGEIVFGRADDEAIGGTNASASAFTGAGKPVEFWISAL